MGRITKAKGAKQSFVNTTKCPHCGGRCIAIRSEQVTEMFRRVTYKCQNEACEYVFTASITPLTTVLPSKSPNPDVHIPTAKG